MSPVVLVLTMLHGLGVLRFSLSKTLTRWIIVFNATFNNISVISWRFHNIILSEILLKVVLNTNITLSNFYDICPSSKSMAKSK